MDHMVKYGKIICNDTVFNPFKLTYVYQNLSPLFFLLYINPYSAQKNDKRLTRPYLFSYLEWPNCSWLLFITFYYFLLLLLLIS